MTVPAPDVDVLIVGAGPTGLALGLALGQLGVSVLLAERDNRLSDVPRAVSIDDEGMRLMQTLGCLRRAREITVPGTGTRYRGVCNQLLLHARGPSPATHGHPVKNHIDHSELLQMLMGRAQEVDGVELSLGWALTAFQQADSGVIARLSGGSSHREVIARYLVGADGGRSDVRRLLGIAMSGTSFAERWLVVDTRNDPHDERFAMHHGDPSRPCVVIAGRDGRCRYEFLLADDEAATDAGVPDLALSLAGRFRQIDPEEVVRATVYTFNALVTERWALGRVILTGDAAHMMPPFAGQGLNSGLRDAGNLAWKLAAVIHGDAGANLLDTYETERRPHVEAVVRLSLRMGALMMTRSRARAIARDIVVGLGMRIPSFRRQLVEMRFMPRPNVSGGFCIPGPARAAGIVGSALPQAPVIGDTGHLVPLDTQLGTGFAIVGLDLAPATVRTLPDFPLPQRATRIALRLGERMPAAATPGAHSVADADGTLTARLGSARGLALLVRPDRMVAGAFEPAGAAEFDRRLRQWFVPAASDSARSSDRPGREAGMSRGTSKAIHTIES